MADSTGNASWTDSIKNTFNKFAKHLFSTTMLFMMAAMAFPMIGAAATTAGTSATLGDLALGTVDMYWEMIKAPFTDGGVVFDALGNAADGNFAANSYEMGMMDHGNMGMEHGAQHTAKHTAPSYTEAGKIEANEAADFWNIPTEDHTQTMLSHPTHK